MMMKVTANSSAGTITERGMTASSAVSLGKNPRSRNMAPTATATCRLATPVACARPTTGVEVLMPTPPRSPAAAVPRPSASTPLLTNCMSGLVQSASLVFWQTVMVPAAFIAAATLAIANGAIRVASNDHDRWPSDGRPIQGASPTAVN